MNQQAIREHARWWAPVLGVAAGWLADLGGMPRDASITLGIAIVTAVWWMLEAVPIPAASLVPITLLPLFGVLSAKTAVAQSYGHPLILLLLGGFFLSKGMERSGVHRRLALGMVRLCGGGGGRSLLLGFMLAASVLSMWISNTATTLMLLPIAMAVLEAGKKTDGVNPMAAPLMLGIAYAASLGGLGSPIGTPPNLVFIEQYAVFTGTVMTFGQWMAFGLPVVVIMVPLTWLWLARHQRKADAVELPETGPWRPAEIRTLIVFGLTALAWMTRAEPFGGWSEWLGLPGANDASVAFVGTLMMFLIPDGTGRPGAEGRLLDWDTAKEVPWGILILFAGGICLAEGIRESGLSEIAAGSLKNLSNLPPLLLVAVVCLVMTFLTELTSNTASTILMMPILGSAAVANGLDPKLLMLPAALSASCAFMLPVATAPNAVIFGTGHLTVQRMVREGLVLNLIGAVVIALYCWLMSR
ncbi:transporter [Haloferula helveola]|uniref:Transporter n=1 Tax=Haloferula helveola TaxID=490095 RepID=A0ABN6H545_9BACT|nr:transporter [Haloferula helveola]